MSTMGLRTQLGDRAELKGPRNLATSLALAN